MTVSRDEVNQMASFMRALNTPETFEADYQPTPLAESIHRPRSSPTVIPGVQEMKDILTRFHAAADGAVQRATTEAASNAVLREALITERTPHGTRIGGWEIQMRQDGKRKFYDVVTGDGTNCIASDLTLYEAAHGLVRILNNGGRLNSQDAINLLRAEQDYTCALNDAVLYKHYLTKNPHDKRVAVFEAKYSAAKSRAIIARDNVTAISERC
jgi:hypothetical protein